MADTVDFSKGGYQGDIVEEVFKRFTATNMQYWWHFREVLRASQAAQPYWKSSAGEILSDSEQRELIAISLLNYAVYTGLAEAITFIEQLNHELHATKPDQWRVFEVRRLWKAAYSSLYTGFNSLCNIVCILVGPKSPWGEKPDRVWNFTPRDAHNLASGRGHSGMADAIGRCQDRLEIRDHLDHYWTIWLAIRQGAFQMDENFKKGYIALRPDSEVRPSIDAHQLAINHIVECAKDFDFIYKELASKEGILDKYLDIKGWQIDYTDLGQPHNGKRPIP